MHVQIIDGSDKWPKGIRHGEQLTICTPIDDDYSLCVRVAELIVVKQLKSLEMNVIQIQSYLHI